jgi:ribonuclease G
MKKEILINSSINEVRVAITEDGKLAEFFIEFPEKERIIGNIYLGKVNKIVTGINAAFVNIGFNQDAFLHFSDVDESLENNFILDEEDEEPNKKTNNKKLPAKEDNKKNKKSNTDEALRKNLPKSKDYATFNTKRSGNIQINLEEKQNVIVQVVREAYAQKGVKITTKIALPGRYLVLLPFDVLLGVSRKISSIHERKRLRAAIRSVYKKEYGCIIRTAAKGKSEHELKKDWEDLVEKWEEITQKIDKSNAPALLYQDMQLANSVVRDLFNNQVKKVILDSKKLHRDILKYIKKFSPHLENKIQLYEGKESIFQHYGIEKELAKTYSRKVNLPSGGDIVIEPTEALFVIDVNSGKGTEKDQEKNALITNLESADEIARQLRLRDIGGMIIVDFIDMNLEQNRRRLFYEMKKHMSKDRAISVVYPLTQLSLMQITRQRINQNIQEKISDTCPVCKGTGRITSKSVIMNNIERWIANFRKSSKEFRLILYVNPYIAESLLNGTISSLTKLMMKYFVKIKLRQDESVKLDHFKFYSVKQQKDITYDYLK